MQRNRLLRRLGFAATDNAKDDRTHNAEFSMLEIDITPLEPKQLALPQARGRRQKNKRAFAQGEMVNQIPNLRSGQHLWSTTPLCPLANNRIGLQSNNS